jgi:Cu2+-exporting ATPase
VLPDSLQQQQNIAHEQGDTLVFVAIDTQVVAAIKLIATLRPDVQEMLQWFKQRGLKLYILSGDQEAPTRTLAEQLEVTGYFANTLPEQKAQRIRELQAQGQQVCFIGDGINDAIALCQAEVSISFSLRGATTIATDTAQIVLMNDHLAQITLLWQVAQNYQDNISHNTYRAQQFSLTAAAGVVLLPYKFWIVEGMWAGQILTGVHIANQPLLNTEKSPKTLTHS